jgi:ABC-type transport system substrate-binding protein
MRAPAVRRAVIAASVAALAVAVAGCGGETAPAGSSGNGGGAGGSLSVAIDAGVTSLDPAVACTAFYDYGIVKNLYDNLVQYGTKTTASGGREIVPALASGWEVADDGKTYTFHLRSGARFASGNPVTADDVVYGLRRTIDKGGCQAFVLTFAGSVAVTAVDDATVRITLKKANPVLLDQLAQTGVAPVDKRLLEAHGGLGKAGDAWLATHSAGAGAYAVESDEPDSAVVLKANRRYWQGRPKSDQVTFRVVGDASTLETLTRSGEVQLAYGVPLKDVEAMQQAGRKLIANQIPFFVYMGLDNRRPPLDDARVRQAIQAAIPVQAIADQLGHGHAKPFAGSIPPAMAFYPNLPVPAQDVAKAKALLAAAGASGMKLDIDVIAGKQLEHDVAVVIQDALQAIGIKASVTTLGSSSFFDRVGGFKSQAYVLLDGAPLNDPAYLDGYLVQCQQDFNWSQYCNHKVDELLARGLASTDATARAALYREIAATVAQDAGLIPIFAPDQVIVADPRLTGYRQQPDGEPLLWTVSAGS